MQYEGLEENTNAILPTSGLFGEPCDKVGAEEFVHTLPRAPQSQDQRERLPYSRGEPVGIGATGLSDRTEQRTCTGGNETVWETPRNESLRAARKSQRNE